MGKSDNTGLQKNNSKIFLRAYKFIKKLITRSFVNCFIVGTSTVTPPAIARTYSE